VAADVDSSFVRLAVERGLVSRALARECQAVAARTGARLARVVAERAAIPVDVARQLHDEARRAAGVEPTPAQGVPQEGGSGGPGPAGSLVGAGDPLASAFGRGAAGPGRGPDVDLFVSPIPGDAPAPSPAGSSQGWARPPDARTGPRPPAASPPGPSPTGSGAGGRSPTASGRGSRGPAELRPGAPFSRYRLVEELGRGGMGVVWKARQLDLDRDVAVKMLLQGAFADDRLRQRFLAEARAVARLVHPNIVAIHDVGSEDGILYFTMEFVDGPTLADRLRGERLPLERSLEIASGVAEALAYAHQQGIVHRDLKPANVLLTRQGTPRIMDFGIAKDIRASSTTQAGEVLGTPAYMSPEQADGRTGQVDGRADIYALGAILFRMLTGRAPFEGPSTYDVITKVVTEEPTPPRKLVPTVPKAVEAIVLRCLAKRPEDRYGSAEALAKELERARRVLSLKAERRPRRRSGGGAAVAVSAAVVSVAVLATVGIVVWGRARGPSEGPVGEGTPPPVGDRRLAVEAAAAALAQRAEDPEAALQTARDAFEQAPGAPETQAALGILLWEVAEAPAEALEHLDAALEQAPDDAAARIARARCLVALERPAGELEVEADALEPLGAVARSVAFELRAELALRQEATSVAVVHLDKAVQLAPEDARLGLRLAALLYRAKRYAATEEEATRVLELAPRSAEAFVLRARARRDRRRRDEARADVDAALAIDPSHEEALALRDELQAEPTPTQTPSPRPTTTPPSPTPALDPHDATHAALDAFAAALRRGDAEAAQAQLEEAVRHRDVRCVDALRERAAACLRARAPELALDDVRRARRLDGGDTAKLLDLGTKALLMLGRAEEAVREAAAGAERHPREPAFLRLQADLLEKAGDGEGAARVWQHLVDVAPEDAGLVHHRAHFLIRQERFAEALEAIERAVELDPRDGHYRVVRGDVLVGLDLVDEARAVFREVADGSFEADDQAAARAKLEEVGR